MFEYEPPLILRVETPAGTFRRSILPATVLPPNEDRGPTAEGATRSAAASFGLPDFVFRPAVHARGSRNRELGDALVAVGDLAASVQVKARVGPTSSPDRERSWLEKAIAKGAKQAVGTVRNLRYSGRCSLVNERGRRVVVDARDKSWVNVVIVDHPGHQGYVPDVDAVVLLRRDWEFLFEQLKSTYAVVEYLHRVRRTGEHVPLGREPVRYYELAAADLVAEAGPGDPRLTAVGSVTASVPLLPQAPVPHDELVRIMLEDLATAPLTETIDQAMVLELLGAIDSAPVAVRAELAEATLGWLSDLAREPDDVTRWWFRRMTWRDRPHLIFAACSQSTRLVRDAFNVYVSLRHQQQAELIPELRDALSVGVLLTPRADGRRPWDTSAAATRGDQRLEPAFRAAMERLWGPLGASTQLDGDELDEVVHAFEVAAAST